MDWQLYTHLNQTLWTRIADYGTDELMQLREEYEIQLKRVKTICRDVLLESGN